MESSIRGFFLLKNYYFFLKAKTQLYLVIKYRLYMKIMLFIINL